MLHFDVRKYLGKCISNHVISINEINSPIVNDEWNKMIPNINVFGASVMRPVMGECDGGL